MPPSTRRSIWSYKLFRIAGIDISIHFTFLIMLFVLALNGIDTALWFVAAFACVLLHELGHALTARCYGIQTHGILLLPIGGLAQLERIPTNPWKELWIALAGPAVNVVLAVGFFFLADVTAELGAWSAIPFTGEDNPLVRAEGLLTKLFWTNVMLCTFNLIPAFPMDGGRVLRALLAFRLDYVRATRYAARTGQVLALVMAVILVPLTANPFLLFIAVFVYLGAGHELTSVERKHRLKHRVVSDAMLIKFDVVRSEEPLWRVVERLRETSQAELPVVRDDVVVGILSQASLLRGLTRRGPSFLVHDLPLESVKAVPVDKPLVKVYEQMQSEGTRTLPVVQAGRLVGLVTWDKLLEFAMIQAALAPHRLEDQMAIDDGPTPTGEGD